ncbi:hypothetical protein MMPV_000339 [Pyropia vietnamensis]
MAGSTSVEALRSEAEALRQRANAAYREQNISSAEALYSEALDKLRQAAPPRPKPKSTSTAAGTASGQAGGKTSPPSAGLASPSGAAKGGTTNGGGAPPAPGAVAAGGADSTASEAALTGDTDNDDDAVSTVSSVSETHMPSDDESVPPPVAIANAVNEHTGNGSLGELVNGHTDQTEDAEATAAAAALSKVSVKEVQSAMAVLLSNRALMRLRLEQYGAAETDATEAIDWDPRYVKAYYRRASASFALGHYRPALKDLKLVTRLVPTDKDAAAKLKECSRRAKEAAFSAAIDSTTPPTKPLSETFDFNDLVVDQSYDGPKLGADGVVDEAFLSSLLARFRSQKPLAARYAAQIILAARRQLVALPNVVTLRVDGNRPKVTVCGDTHGQYYDLLHIFELNGLPSATNPYLFNGDFVDRGSFSVEVIMTLLAYKVAYPESMHLTRGNHETLAMNSVYGFQGEVKAKYNDTLFKLFSECFRAMPLAYVLDGTAVESGRRALVLHGGLFSKDGVTLADLQALDRNREPDSGLMAEMLWSDPQKEAGWGQSKRGIGVSFGPDVTSRFLDANDLALVVRSHEMKEEGYEVEASGRLITIFSAPNYCDVQGNKGAFITFKSEMVPEFTQFAAVPHPNVRPMAYARDAAMMGLL